MPFLTAGFSALLLPLIVYTGIVFLRFGGLHLSASIPVNSILLVVKSFGPGTIWSTTPTALFSLTSGGAVSAMYRLTPATLL